LNYHRDDQPLMNLLMAAPLYDSRGTLRNRIGAQVDVSGISGTAPVWTLGRLIERENMADGGGGGGGGYEPYCSPTFPSQDHERTLALNGLIMHDSPRR